MPIYHYFETFISSTIEQIYKETLLLASIIWLIFSFKRS